jgi:hypothetical protein
MATLSPELRKQLGDVIKAARREAVPAAEKALATLAVGAPRPLPGMSSDAQALRRRLRAHGRQLGDERDPETEAQATRRLAHEVAYEHWHRMLFARFLAENQLLIEPDSGVAISMEECEELARERGEDPWSLAGRAASRMLPRIFRPDDPVLELALAPEARQALERGLASLPAEVFTADDSLGWTYQLWQEEEKARVNASGVTIGSDELPAVTQLFTEHYMVLFLFHNTLGAWRAGKILGERPQLAQHAEHEDELRRAIRLEGAPGYDFAYVRFLREPAKGDADGEPLGCWRPAVGAFEGWPRRAADLRVLDPCCGSGHFLVEGLTLLVPLRMAEEGLTRDDAIRAVLADNLFGLELDPRCTQIAAFNLALAAWRMAGRPIELPPLQIACSGLAIGATRKEWIALAVDDPKLRAGMEWLYELFSKAPELGSLIDPRSGARDWRRMDYELMEPLLHAALAREKGDADQVERAVAARGMARAAELLAGTYTLVVTNVPYLGRGNQSATLKKFADEHYLEAKADLATIFVSRAFRWLGSHGAQAVVTPQSWLFLTSYRKLREKLLSLRTWNVVARLGPGAFQTIGGHVVNVALSVLSAEKPAPDSQMAGLDVAALRDARAISPREKASRVAGSEGGHVVGCLQARQLQNPDARIAFVEATIEGLLEEHVSSIEGLTTGDADRFIRRFWELSRRGASWSWFIQSVDSTNFFAGRSDVVLWEDGRGALRRWPTAHNFPSTTMNGYRVLGGLGLRVSQMGTLACTLYTGEVFGKNAATVVPDDYSFIPAVWCYCTSQEFREAVRSIDRSLKVTNATLAKVPFDLAHWQKVAAEKYPHGLPEPQSDDPTQWLFHGHPVKADPQTVLHVAVARLLGYRWPPEQDAELRLADEARAWVARCDELVAFGDDDGIVCLPPLRGEFGAAERLRRLLTVAFGDVWSAKERQLLAEASQGGRPAESLDEWLRDHCFEEHCKLFHHRPFVWHVWDGRKDGFHALVSYHKLAAPEGAGRRTFEALTYSYLGDWILRQRSEQAEGKAGADGRLAAALDLQAQLERILEGEPPYDIFVRWKPLHQQAIGWEPDIDDGVRLNIRPFLRAELRTGGRKGAGILRFKPNLTWKKDRGKDPQQLRPKEDYPWFWGCSDDVPIDARTDFIGRAEFDGNRWNDLHYTNPRKREARARARREQS